MFGRAVQCGAIDELLDRVRASESRVLHLAGVAGIGKTALCSYAVSRAEGMTVLPVVGMEWESNYPFAGLSEMLAPVRHRVGELVHAQRGAVSAMLGDAGEPGIDQFALAGATLAMLSEEAAYRPVLVVIDDAQWLDAATVSVTSFVFRRLSNDAVGLIVASRSDQPLALRGLGTTLLVEGLGEHDAVRLLAERTTREVAATVAEELTRRTSGNPLALIELADELSASQLAGHAPLPDPLPIGPRGMASFGRRLAGLPTATRKSLVILAAAGPASSVTVAAALDRVGLRVADLEPAEAGGVVRSGDAGVRFVHPLVRAAAYSMADGATKRRAHRVLAEATVGDVERHAWHLAEATLGPSEEVARTLDLAAETAMRRGGAMAAAPALARAAEITPAGTERPPRLLRAADALFLAGRRHESTKLLTQALSLPLPPDIRSLALLLQAKQALWSPIVAQAPPVLMSSFTELAETDRTSAVIVGLLLANLLTSLGDTQASLEVSARASALHPADADLGLLADVYHALIALVVGDAGPLSRLRDESLRALADRLPIDAAALVTAAIVQLWNCTDRSDEAIELAERQLEMARRRSAASLMAYPLALLGDLHLQRGATDRARANFDQAITLCREIEQEGLVGFVRAYRASVAAQEGDRETCTSEGQLALETGRRTGQRYVEMFVNGARGLLELGSGNCDAAVRCLEPNVELKASARLVLPTVVRWEGDYVHALIGAGKLDRARAALSDLEDGARRTGSRWGRGVALRGRALLDKASAEDALREAIELQATMPFEQARSRLVLGDHLRRAARIGQARSELTTAADLFIRCGAHPWLERANSAMRATGVRRARRGDDGERLTEQELQVALAIADGATNKEAAAELFLSQKTVEYHLAKVFRKLAVTNRTQLATAMRRHQPA